MVVAMTMGLAYAADETEKGQKIVDGMTQVFNNLNADPDMGWFRSNLSCRLHAPRAPMAVWHLKAW